MTTTISLSEAIENGMATLGWNPRPEGWREANFPDLLVWVAPECPPLDGESDPEN